MWLHDEKLWGGPGPEIGNRLGWLTIADRLLEEAGDLKAFAEQCKADGLTDAVLLGMGGSSLAPEVFRLSFGDRGGLRLHVLDSTDPGAVLTVERAVDVAKTLFIVSSKSGGTIETLSHFRYFFEKAGRDGSHFVAVTDPGSPLEDLAGEHGFRRAFLNDPDIGGRYSALSYFGIVPAARRGHRHRARCSSARRSPSRRASTTTTPRTTPGCGSAPRSASCRCTGATRPRSWSTSRSRTSGCGSSS